MNQTKENVRTMKIAFLEPFLNIRGTSVALYDYAHFNETILGNESIIFTEPYEHRAWHHDSSGEVHEKFNRRFNVFYYRSTEEIQEVMDKEGVDILYIIKCGQRTGIVPEMFKGIKTIVHAVFDPIDPHGDVYCVISEWLNVEYGTDYQVLPHIIHLPEHSDSLRAQLHIPEDAIVFGRYGGQEEFDIPYVHATIERFAKDHPEVYFLFMNTRQHVPPSHNVIYFDRTVDGMRKRQFINTCDAMMYGRNQGETFGIAIGEFSSCNKPILAPSHAKDKMHHMILKENAIWYGDEEELYGELLSFQKQAEDKDWNMYRSYSPENVMKIFQDVLNDL